MTEYDVRKEFIELKEKGLLTLQEKKRLYYLADTLRHKYGWNINDEAFLGMYEDENMEGVYD